MSEEVESYHVRALRWWAAKLAPHGETCGCLPCADCRAYLGRPALVPKPTGEARRGAPVRRRA